MAPSCRTVKNIEPLPPPTSTFKDQGKCILKLEGVTGTLKAVNGHCTASLRILTDKYVPYYLKRSTFLPEKNDIFLKIPLQPLTSLS